MEGSPQQNSMQDLYYSHVLMRATCGYMMANNHISHGSQVGALVVQDDAIISAGVNAEVADTRYHAEEIALQRLHTRGDLSRSTMYVTLEPCNGNPFHEREHCCDQIANRGVGRVVFLERKRNDNEGGGTRMIERGVDVSRLHYPQLDQMAAMLAYGFTQNNQVHRRDPDSIRYSLRRLSRNLHELSIKLPAIDNADVEAIRQQLKVDIAKL